MHIGIDVRYLSHGLLNGIHTYLTNLVPAVLAGGEEHTFVLYADAKAPFELTDLPPNATLRGLPWSSPRDSVRNDLRFARLSREDRLDVLHFPANYGWAAPGTATVITLHDALNLFPLWEATRRDLARPKTVAKTCYLQAMTRASVRGADMLITVSEDAKRDILRHRAFPASRIVPVPHAPAPAFHAAHDAAHLAAIRVRFGLPSRFVLADAFKNPAVLVRAWGRLPWSVTSGCRIVFFSRSAVVRPEVAGAVAREEAQLLVRPTVSELAALYALADVFVFPSWIEGFGLPILEAMASGTPVIASDRGAIPEVAGGAALLADAEDDAALARHLERVLTTPAEAERLRRLGAARAGAFSWERSAAMTLDVYRQAARRPHPSGQRRAGGRVAGRRFA